MLAPFAQKFNTQHLGEHAVASPLGLWLLLALAAPHATGKERVALEDSLGAPAEQAHAVADQLLAAAHPAVASAVALWTSSTLSDPHAVKRWVESLPARAEHGPIPSQSDADAWAKKSTLGLIESFPLEMTPSTIAVLASTLATKVSWATPFDSATSADLAGAFGTAPGVEVLSAPAGMRHHRTALVQTEAAGVVAAHAATSRDGLSVLSVIADPSCAPALVHEAAAQARAALATGTGPNAHVVSLYDAEVTGHAWDIVEETVTVLGDPSRRERAQSYLPAWTARTEIDLRSTAGVEPAFAALAGLARPDTGPHDFAATQVAVASYGREGFEAAALTSLGAVCSSMPSRYDVPQRTATVRFNRPYAVLAVAEATRPDLERGYGTVDLGVPDWDGLPVFHAWVAEPS